MEISSLINQITIYWPTLSAAEKSEIQPFLRPPATPGSWVELGTVGLRAAPIQWDTVSNDRIKVWWQTRRPEDAAKAAAILEEVDTVIWPEIVEYMGGDHRAPLSDAGLPGSGGDGLYDIYLVHNAPPEPGKPPVLGWVSPLEDAQGEAGIGEVVNLGDKGGGGAGVGGTAAGPRRR